MCFNNCNVKLVQHSRIPVLDYNFKISFRIRTKIKTKMKSMLDFC